MILLIIQKIIRSYREKWRDWPFEASATNNSMVLNPVGVVP